MKKVNIEVRIADDKILSAIKHNLGDGISARLEIIGILENLIKLQNDKIESKKSKSFKL